MLAIDDKEHEYHELGFIKNIGFGLRDTGSPCLFFNINTHGSGSLQCLFGKDIDTFVRLANVYDIKSLENKHIVVKTKDFKQYFVRFY